jgi:hypothetical protein
MPTVWRKAEIALLLCVFDPSSVTVHSVISSKPVLCALLNLGGTFVRRKAEIAYHCYVWVVSHHAWGVSQVSWYFALQVVGHGGILC